MMRLKQLLNRCSRMATFNSLPKEAALTTKFQRKMRTIMIQRWTSHRRRNLKRSRGIRKKSRRSVSQKKVGLLLFIRIHWLILPRRICKKDMKLALRGVANLSNMVMAGGLLIITLRLRITKRSQFGTSYRSLKNKN